MKTTEHSLFRDGISIVISQTKIDINDISVNEFRYSMILNDNYDASFNSIECSIRLLIKLHSGYSERVILK